MSCPYSELNQQYNANFVFGCIEHLVHASIATQLFPSDYTVARFSPSQYSHSIIVTLFPSDYPVARFSSRQYSHSIVVTLFPSDYTGARFSPSQYIATQLL